VEIFGAGTACVVCPVGSITYLDREIVIPQPEYSLSRRFRDIMGDIHYGRISHPWGVDIE